MKRWVLILFFLISPVGAASNIPSEIALIFPDRTINLNFEAQPELLQSVPQYTLIVGSVKIPLDTKNQLLSHTDDWNIEVSFETQIDPVMLHDFFGSASLLVDDHQEPVLINTDSKGHITFEGTPQHGFRIDEAHLVFLLNQALHTGQKHIYVPGEKVFSEVVIHPHLKKRGIREVIGVGESNFSGSPETRIQNITTAVKKFNGAVIKKNRYFSFNHILDSVAEEDGFVPELVIKGNKTEKELGGGVCQVSTTAFRAAMASGLHIKERRNHSYAIQYYKPFGLDAAIYLGAADLRFKNNTPGDILVQAFVEDNDVFFVFYGTDDGRKVALEGPFISEYRPAPTEAIVYETEDLPFGEVHQIDYAHDGFTAEWVRTVEKDGEETVETFASLYRPWRAKQLHGVRKVSMNYEE